MSERTQSLQQKKQQLNNSVASVALHQGQASIIDARSCTVKQRRLQSMADNSSHVAKLLDVQRMADTSRASQKPPPAQRLPNEAGVIQRMTLLPFNDVDDNLVRFINQHAAGMAGATQQGAPGQKIGVDEKLVIVGHGNPVTLSAHEDGEDGEVEMFTPDTLATFLSEHVLPDNYAGEIVVWACNSATPSKYHQLAKDYFTAQEQAHELELSFIQRLERELLAKNKGYMPSIKGAKGYVTLDRRWDRASVYADEERKFLGNTASVEDGFITTEQEVDGGWYHAPRTMIGGNSPTDGSDSDDSSFEGSNFEGSMSDEDDDASINSNQSESASVPSSAPHRFRPSGAALALIRPYAGSEKRTNASRRMITPKDLALARRIRGERS